MPFRVFYFCKQVGCVCVCVCVCACVHGVVLRGKQDEHAGENNACCSDEGGGVGDLSKPEHTDADAEDDTHVPVSAWASMRVCQRGSARVSMY